jgi:glutaredoxin
VASIIKSNISDNKVMIFSKSYCPYCKKAKKAFSERKITYKAVELDEISNGSEIQTELLKMTGQKTVPNIFIKGIPTIYLCMYNKIVSK